jgi:hypothetical protein
MQGRRSAAVACATARDDGEMREAINIRVRTEASVEALFTQVARSSKASTRAPRRGDPDNVLSRGRWTSGVRAYAGWPPSGTSRRARGARAVRGHLLRGRAARPGARTTSTDRRAGRRRALRRWADEVCAVRRLRDDAGRERQRPMSIHPALSDASAGAVTCVSSPTSTAHVGSATGCRSGGGGEPVRARRRPSHATGATCMNHAGTAPARRRSGRFLGGGSLDRNQRAAPRLCEARRATRSPARRPERVTWAPQARRRFAHPGAARRSQATGCRRASAATRDTGASGE